MQPSRKVDGRQADLRQADWRQADWRQVDVRVKTGSDRLECWRATWPQVVPAKCPLTSRNLMHRILTEKLCDVRGVERCYGSYGC
jgi:hypothetical protein